MADIDAGRLIDDEDMRVWVESIGTDYEATAETRQGTSARSATPTPHRPGQPTIEDRLDVKATEADRTDNADRRSLGLMTDEEIRKRLFDRGDAARQADERIREMNKGVTLGGLTIKDLVNEGRR